jgi:hypothetical protein
MGDFSQIVAQMEGKALKPDEKKVMSAKTPEEYVDRMIGVDLSQGEKQRLSRLWQKQTGYSAAEIAHARNRHPYWRKRKAEGNLERTKRRLKAYDVQRPYHPFSLAEDDLLNTFLTMNKRGRDGRYQHKDYEIAQKLNIKLTSVQCLRRKYNLITRIVALKNIKPSAANYRRYMKFGEKRLRDLSRELAQGDRDVVSA